MVLGSSPVEIKYTVEFEDHEHLLIFLGINITNNTTNKKHEFKVYQKDAIPNIQIKPKSYA